MNTLRLTMKYALSHLAVKRHRSSSPYTVTHCLVPVKIFLMCLVVVDVSRFIFIYKIWQMFLLNCSVSSKEGIESCAYLGNYYLRDV